MALVYFDPLYGGDGTTVTDDSDPSTGLRNGGHRLRFVPALQQTVNVTAFAVDMAQSVSANKDATENYKNLSKGYRDEAISSKNIAVANANTAIAKASEANASAIFANQKAASASTSAGVASTHEDVAVAKAAEAVVSASEALASQLVAEDRARVSTLSATTTRRDVTIVAASAVEVAQNLADSQGIITAASRQAKRSEDAARLSEYHSTRAGSIDDLSVIKLNPKVINENMGISSEYNGHSVGGITVALDKIVTVGNGAKWLIS